MRRNFGRVLVGKNESGEKFVSQVYIEKGDRATMGSDRATLGFVTVK